MTTKTIKVLLDLEESEVVTIRVEVENCEWSRQELQYAAMTLQCAANESPETETLQMEGV